ncbi:MAG: hypothetical protein PF795_00855 [Kiritimatiellae bacterium]|jgi:hypothetical protein|nr:hypothetical protein [Kiritimatiellia bacterium]
MCKNIIWVIFTRNDFPDWVEHENCIACIPQENPWLILVNGAKKLDIVPQELFNDSHAEYRCWIHFGADGRRRSFDKEEWIKALNGNPNAGGVDKSGIFGKSFEEKYRTPHLLLNSDFAPYSVRAANLDWQKKFFKLAPRIKGFMAGEKPVEQEAGSLKQDLEGLWAQAMKYRNWGRKRDALFEAAIVLRQTALLIKLSTESNGIDLNGLDLNPEKERFDKALKHLEEVTEESEKKWFLAMKVLNWPGEGDDVVAFAKKLLNAADSLVANVPPEPKGNTDE